MTAYIVIGLTGLVIVAFLVLVTLLIKRLVLFNRAISQLMPSARMEEMHKEARLAVDEADAQVKLSFQPLYVSKMPVPSTHPASKKAPASSKHRQPTQFVPNQSIPVSTGGDELDDSTDWTCDNSASDSEGRKNAPVSVS